MFAKKTKGWEIDPKTGKSKQLYTVVGYYPTRKEALTALCGVQCKSFMMLMLQKSHSRMYMSDGLMNIFPTVSDSNVKGYRAAWALCDKLARMRFVDVKLDHLQMIVDESGKNYPTLRKLKVLLGLMYKYAVIHEIIPKERNLVEYLDIKKAGNPNAYNRKPFSKTEVKKDMGCQGLKIYIILSSSC